MVEGPATRLLRTTFTASCDLPHMIALLYRTRSRRALAAAAALAALLAMLMMQAAPRLA